MIKLVDLIDPNTKTYSEKESYATTNPEDQKKNILMFKAVK